MPITGIQPDTTLPRPPAYKEYIATLVQTSTTAPVATVIKNTLGATVTWTRTGVGEYRGTATGKFNETATENIVILGASAGLAQASVADGDYILIETFIPTFVASDDIIANTGIHVIVLNS